MKDIMIYTYKNNLFLISIKLLFISYINIAYNITNNKHKNLLPMFKKNKKNKKINKLDKILNFKIL